MTKFEWEISNIRKVLIFRTDDFGFQKNLWSKAITGKDEVIARTVNLEADHHYLETTKISENIEFNLAFLGKDNLIDIQYYFEDTEKRGLTQAIKCIEKVNSNLNKIFSKVDAEQVKRVGYVLELVIPIPHDDSLSNILRENVRCFSELEGGLEEINLRTNRIVKKDDVKINQVIQYSNIQKMRVKQNEGQIAPSANILDYLLLVIDINTSHKYSGSLDLQNINAFLEDRVKSIIENRGAYVEK